MRRRKSATLRLAASPKIAVTSRPVTVRDASSADLEAIRAIYNEGIEDRVATLDVDAKSRDSMADWWSQHTDRYGVLVATESDEAIGWAALNPFSYRCAHADIADLSVYVARDHRGRGIGYELLAHLTQLAKERGFHKIVLHALNVNEHGKALYRKAGFNEVGIFREHGRLDGRFVDVVAMELLLQ
jgi:L-amino acid N-acyltransferase YncA